jgi:hypothetical protein
MIDIMNLNKLCIHEGCSTRATFNIEGEEKGFYCVIHKTPNMANVLDKPCIHTGCKTKPVFNYEGQKTPLYCMRHKLKDMINIKDNKCNYPECKTIAGFNFIGEKTPLYCSKHKSTNMINIVHRTCKTEHCYTYVQEKYNGYCLYCYVHMFPDKPVFRNYKTKEYAVVEYIKNKFPVYDWVADRKIPDGCSKRRPDLLLDLGYQIIMIEIDENQHIDYDCSCENKRLMELSLDVNHRPIIFIRFNPDDYDNGDEHVTSCWGYDKSGLAVIKKSKRKEWDQRLKILEEQVNYWIQPENVTEKMVEVVQLYF